VGIKVNENKWKRKKKGKEGPCENPYKEWIFVSKGHRHPLVTNIIKFIGQFMAMKVYTPINEVAILCLFG
jgi:hypothetical protein